MNAHRKLWNCGIAETDNDEWLSKRTTTIKQFDEIRMQNEYGSISYESVEVRGMYLLFFALYYGGSLEV